MRDLFFFLRKSAFPRFSLSLTLGPSPPAPWPPLPSLLPPPVTRSVALSNICLKGLGAGAAAAPGIGVVIPPTPLSTPPPCPGVSMAAATGGEEEAAAREASICRVYKWRSWWRRRKKAAVMYSASISTSASANIC
jgi:hypothetical protein